MPYKIDLFAVFIFLGIVQAIFLSFFFLSKGNRKIQSNLFYGLLLLTMAGCILEIFLMYTGYIINCLFLVDFSEPLSFLIGPFFYLTIISIVHGKVRKVHYVHLIFPLIYFILIIPFFLQPDAVKFNSWVESYKLNLPYRPYQGGDPRNFWLTDHHTQLTMASFVLYAVLCLRKVLIVFRSKQSLFYRPSSQVLKNLRWISLQMVLPTVLIFAIKYYNPNDTGDHILASYIAMGIYLTSFYVIQQSRFFRPAAFDEPQKYKTSSLTEEQQETLLNKLKQIMVEKKPFLQSTFSLPDLAQQVGVSVHTLSQVINEGLGKNFFEMTAEYRIEEAKHLLKAQQHVKVEEIAEQVGYLSKSSFNTAFKKITGKTPSQFRDQ